MIRYIVWLAAGLTTCWLRIIVTSLAISRGVVCPQPYRSP